MPNLYTFQKVVTTSGTPVQLPDQSVDQGQSVSVKAKAANTGTITLGNSSANALNSAAFHVKLGPGDSLDELNVSNINSLWIDATVNGEGVEVTIG